MAGVFAHEVAEGGERDAVREGADFVAGADAAGVGAGGFGEGEDADVAVDFGEEHALGEIERGAEGAIFRREAVDKDGAELGGVIKGLGEGVLLGPDLGLQFTFAGLGVVLLVAVVDAGDIVAVGVAPATGGAGMRGAAIAAGGTQTAGGADVGAEAVIVVAAAGVGMGGAGVGVGSR